MLCLADENIERTIVERLRADGHDVAWVADMEPGIDDDAVLAAASAEERLLITSDKDFGELVFRLGRASAGVLLLRLLGLSADEKAATVSGAFAAHGPELAGAFSVISPGQVRIRRP
jgi:predicted nuclease of predicted toxin-antitoxin system